MLWEHVKKGTSVEIKDNRSGSTVLKGKIVSIEESELTDNLKIVLDTGYEIVFREG